MKQKFLSFLTLAAALAGLAACNEQMEMPSQGTAGLPVRLTATNGIALTRAATDVHNTFAAGDEVAVGFSGTTTTAVYTLGAPDGSGNSTLTVADGSSELFYPNNDVKLYAVYPATVVSGASPSEYTHTVAADQTTDPAYQTSDLLIANKEVAQSQMGQSQNLQFSHALTKLTVIINNPSGLSISAVKMKNVNRKVPLTTSTGCALGAATAATDGNGNDISFGPASASTTTSQTYACVFPAQSWSSADFLTIETSAGTATYTLNSSAFTNGNPYALTINLSPLSLGQTTALTGLTGTTTPAAVAGFTIYAIPTQNYTGSAITPEPTVTCGGTPLTKDTDYTLDYKNNTEAGTAYVIVTGIGNYAGLSAVATFTIKVTI